MGIFVSFRTTLQRQITWKEGSLTLAKTSNFVSLFCLLWQLSIPFFTQMASTRLIVLHGWENSQLSLLSSWKNMVAASYFGEFWGIFVPKALTSYHANVLWQIFEWVFHKSIFQSHIHKQLPISSSQMPPLHPNYHKNLIMLLMTTQVQKAQYPC